MEGLKGFVDRYPVMAYVGLCYAITWAVWFSIPLAAGGEWALVKVLTGIGLGPGLAAVLLDRARGTAGKVTTGRWYAAFSIVFLLVALINVSILFTGDAARNSGFATAQPPGLTLVGGLGSLLAASVCGFIFASAAASRSRQLATILSCRAPLRWWLVALFLPGVLSLLSLAVTRATGGEMPPSVVSGLPIQTWVLFIPRSILFTLLVVTVGEEPGWRGWMLPELQKRFNPLISTLLVGVVWGLWHLPLFLNGMYPGGPSGIVSYLVLCPTLAVVFTWLYNRTGGNLLLALVLHMTINNTSRFLPAAPSIAWLGPAFALVLIFSERMWRRREAVGPRAQRGRRL